MNGPIMLLLETLLELFFRTDSEFCRHASTDAVLIANCLLLNSAWNIRKRKKSEMKESQLLFENGFEINLNAMVMHDYQR
jgi:hypothetical protein